MATTLKQIRADVMADIAAPLAAIPGPDFTMERKRLREAAETLIQAEWKREQLQALRRKTCATVGRGAAEDSLFLSLQRQRRIANEAESALHDVIAATLRTAPLQSA